MSIYGSINEGYKDISSNYKLYKNPKKEFIEAHLDDGEDIDNFLNNYRNSNTYMFLDKNSNKLVCVFLVYNDRGHHILNDFQMTPAYRGKGLAKAFLDFAVKKAKADHLWVFENNKVAINLYLSYGFKFTGDKYKEDGKIRLYMSL